MEDLFREEETDISGVESKDVEGWSIKDFEGENPGFAVVHIHVWFIDNKMEFYGLRRWLLKRARGQFYIKHEKNRSLIQVEKVIREKNSSNFQEQTNPPLTCGFSLFLSAYFYKYFLLQNILEIHKTLSNETPYSIIRLQ